MSEIKTEIKQNADGSYTITDAHSTADVIRWLLTQDSKETVLYLLGDTPQQEPEPVSEEREFWLSVVESLDKNPASPTQGMTLRQRISHVGGQENAAGYIEFGSVMAVKALISHVLRDTQQRKPLTDEQVREIAKQYALSLAFPYGGKTTPEMFARAIEAAHGIKGDA